MTRVIRIENAGPDRRARRLHFEDGSEPLTTAAAVVRVLALQEDSEVDLARLGDEIRRVGGDAARERVLKLLGYRDRTEFELHKRLTDDGYPASLADELVARFVELGYVDDERYARRWAVERAGAGYGPARIERELRMKGVAPALAASAARVEDDEEAVRRARLVIARLDLSDRKAREKAFARLVRKGFSSAVASRAIGVDDST